MMAAFLIYVMRWAVVLTMLYSLYGLFMKRETLHAVNRVVLLLILMASMVLPFCQVETRKGNLVAEGRELIEQRISELQVASRPSLSAVDDISPEAAHVPADALPAEQSPDLGSMTLLLIVFIYMAGVAIAWLRYLWSLGSLLRLIRQARRIDMPGLPKGIVVLVHPAVKTPCSWMHWILLSPADARLHTVEGAGVGLQGLLRHESAHIRLGHSWDVLLCELTCRMQWCNTFAWMLRQDLRDVHEYQADRSVLRSGIDENEYQLLLIRKATSTGLQPVVNAFNQSPIKRRFTMMYRKPSRRWVALRAAYLLPLGALALMAFARPQAMKEIEKKVEATAPVVANAIKKMAQQMPSLRGEGQALETLTPPTADAETAKPGPAPTETGTESGIAEMPDSNLVAADLAESGHSVLGASHAKTPVELLDSTMQAVGARKIADGTYVGHFQPNLNSDTVRIARATILDRDSRQTGEHSFLQHADDPCAYSITLNAETRKERTGYYIRYLQPVASTVRSYDKKEVDPKMLSTDSVLTKRSSSRLLDMIPAAIERDKKETRIYMYTAFLKEEPPLEILRQQETNRKSDYAIVDELTGDKYVMRAMDWDYFKFVRDEYVTLTIDGQNVKDTIKIYQFCQVFPPLGKNVRDVHFGSATDDAQRYSGTFDLNDIPRKGRVITN